MKKLVALMLAVLLLAGSCAGYKNVRIDNVSITSIRLESTSSAKVTVRGDVVNPTKHGLTLESVDAVLVREGRDFVRFITDGSVYAPAGTTTTLTVPIHAIVLDPISILTTGLNLKSWNLDEMVVDGRAVLRSDAGARKTIRIKDMPVRQLIKDFNISR